MINRHIGSSLNNFLDDEGILPEVQAKAFKEVIAFKVKRYIADNKITNTRAAIYFGISEKNLKKLINGDHIDIEILTIIKVINKIGKR